MEGNKKLEEIIEIEEAPPPKDGVINKSPLIDTKTNKIIKEKGNIYDNYNKNK